MKANTNKKNKSASRKLVPAVAMLTTSAVMLSSATYAWFTLNKEVEVTGMQMSAATGDALEISLGAYSATITSITAPSDKNDPSWKRSVAFSDYYAGFSALKPASSDNGLSIIAIDESKVSGGGAAVADGATIYTVGSAGTGNEAYNSTAKIVYSGAENAATTVSGYTDADAGYYLDIPMWIRTNKINKSDASTDNGVKIDCTVSITDTTNTLKNGDLKNAVRVAIVPVTVDDTLAGITSGVPAAASGALTVAANNSSSVFGLTKGTHTTNGVLKSGATGTYGETNMNKTPTIYAASAELRSATLDGTDSDGVNDANNTPETITFNLPSATQDDYAGSAFIVRIWLEGESKYCLDATANQDWRLDFHFDIHDEENESGHGTDAPDDKA